jgi:FixJ family two-component response regulator
MPDMSGDEMLPLLLKQSPDAKVIVITGYAVDERQFPGAKAIIQKPFKQKDLMRTVREVLDA